MHCLKTLLPLLVGIIFISAITTTDGDSSMKPPALYEKSDLASVTNPPQVFNIKGGLFNGGGLFGGYRNVSIFSVPIDNAVGSNDMGNAITVISFPKEKIEFEKYFRNAVEQLQGGGVYLPTATPNLVGFAQVRRFVLFDLKHKTHREYRIEMSIGNTIEKVAVADAGRRRFLMEIEEQRRGTSDPWDSNKILKLIDLSEEKHKILKELPKGPGTTWTTTHDRVLLWKFSDKKLQVFNMNLEPAHHPLEEALNRNIKYIDSIVIQVHPHLPFAVLSGGRNGSIYLSWGKDKETTPFSLFSAATLFSFSPDGKWLVFKREDFANDTTKTYLLPVSEKYPHYLGSPILLADTYFNEGKFAWTSNPTGFVGSSLDKIYRWDLENQDFPEKGKMSFHDYIVKKDLEKLAKEKRQGLGK